MFLKLSKEMKNSKELLISEVDGEGLQNTLSLVCSSFKLSKAVDMIEISNGSVSVTI